jgi:hypothetical protein
MELNLNWKFRSGFENGAGTFVGVAWLCFAFSHISNTWTAVGR